MVRRQRSELAGASPNKPPEWARDGREPLWTESGIERLLLAGTKSHLSRFTERHAILTAPGEKLQAARGNGRVINHHFLRAGHPRLLAAAWQDIFIEVGRVYGFSREEVWGRQQAGFQALFAGFLGSTVTRSQFGWVSLITAQRPHYLRNWEDSRVQISTEAISVGRSQPFTQPMLTAGFHQQPGHDFLFSGDGPQTKQKLRHVQVQRLFHAPELLGRDRRLIEWRYIPAVDGEHDAVLQSGGIPSLRGLNARPRHTVGLTGYLNLAVVALDQASRCHVLHNILEIDPVSGRLVSLRAFESPLELALLNASVVEQVGLGAAVSELLGESKAS